MDARDGQDSIVVGVDGSEHAARAVRWAAGQAALEGRSLLVVGAGAHGESRTEDGLDLVREAHPEVTVAGLATDRDAREVLLELSERAHLLVLGSRGRGVLKSVLLGSVSAAISTHAACPVVVCRPPHDEDSSLGVLVGADGTREGLPVIEFAYRQASLRGLPLTVLHCYWDAVAAVADYRRSRGQSAVPPELDSLRALLSESSAGFSERYPDVRVEFRLEHGLVDEALAAREEHWDLIVVGRHPVTPLARVLTGSMAVAVVERARSTVAVVPQELPLS